MKNTYVIKKRGTFRYTFKKGNYYKGEYVDIIITKQNRIKKAFGVCVSKKNGNSVFRNKLKRWTREIYKLEEDNLINGITIVISFKKQSVNDLDFWILYNEIKKGMNYLGVYKNN